MPSSIRLRPRGLLFLVALAAACSGQPATPPKTALISLAPAELDFGLLVPGTTKALQLTVGNDGTGPLTLAQPQVADDARGAFQVEGVPAELAAGAKATVTVTYQAAAAEGTDTARLLLTSNATNVPSAGVALHARTAPASCADGARDGDETAVDCGGSKCPGCAAGKACGAAADCGAGLACAGGACGECASASECRAGEICSSGKCGGCHLDGDCADGSTCEAGLCKVCPGATGRLDTRSDARNCGRCGNVCPAPVHAQAMCVQGQCGRSACERGYFDFDAATTFGCETSCTGTVCHGPAGDVHVDNPPLPEKALGQRDFASGSSYGGQLQTGPRYTNVGVLGQSTPPPAAGGPQLKSAHYSLQGGLDPARH